MEEYFFTCPYCWQRISVLLDPSAGGQRIIEDCEVCCHPIDLIFETDESRSAIVDLQVDRAS